MAYNVKAYSRVEGKWKANTAHELVISQIPIILPLLCYKGIDINGALK